MYVKNSHFVIYLALAVLVGFGASFLFSSLSSDNSQLSGDISKATRYSEVRVDPAFTALEEKLQNDKEFFNTMKNNYLIIDARVDRLEELTSETISVCSKIPEFKGALNGIVSLNAKAFNTKTAVAQATKDLNVIASGKSAPEYEQSSNNVYLGFKKAESNLALGKAFVERAISYLKDNSDKDCEEIATLITEWTVYLQQDATINGSEEDVEYWKTCFEDLMAEYPAIQKAYVKYCDERANFIKEFNNSKDVASGKALAGLFDIQSLDKDFSLGTLNEIEQLTTTLDFGETFDLINIIDY